MNVGFKYCIIISACVQDEYYVVRCIKIYVPCLCKRTLFHMGYVAREVYLSL